MLAGRGVRIGAAVLAGLAVVFVLGFFVFFPRMAAWVVKHRAIPKLEKRIGRQIEVRSIHAGWGKVVLEGVSVRGTNDPDLRSLATVDRVATTFRLWAAFKGDVQVGEIKVENPRLAFVRTADGRDNWSDILERLRKKAPEEGPKRGPRFKGLTVTGGAIDVDDQQSGVRVSARDITASMTPGGPATARLGQVDVETIFGPKAAARAVQVEADLSDPTATAKMVVEGGVVSLWPHMSLTGIQGTIEPAGSSRASIHFEGGYGGVEEKLWEADGWFDPRTQDAELSLQAARFTLDRLAPILAGTPVQTPERASVETRLDLAMRKGEQLLFRGSVSLAGLTVYHPSLAEDPVKDLAFTGDIRGRFLRGARMLEISQLNVHFRGLNASLEGYAALKGGREESGQIRTLPRLGIHFLLPKVTCQQALNGFPPELMPKLQGFKLKGDFHADVHFDVDWANPDALVLDGSVGLFDCEVKEAPKEMDVERLERPFEQVVELEQDKWVSFVVGPSNPNYVPIYDISPYLMKSFLTTEDAGFFKHRGFIVKEFRSALIKNIKAGYFKYGASSITMQFVKNVLLYREKTLARKLQELFLTHYVESTLEKERILEIYLNVIEFGPGIYGIGPAARHYFGKHPRDLNVVEAAFFSTILPSPKKRHLQYCDGELNKWAAAKVQRIIKLMHERNHLTEEEYQAAVQTPLVFDRTDAPNPDECKKITKRYIKNARPTTPQRVQN